jgi:hypothetical protein
VKLQVREQYGYNDEAAQDHGQAPRTPAARWARFDGHLSHAADCSRRHERWRRERGRGGAPGTRPTIAGWDFTFSIPKSASEPRVVGDVGAAGATIGDAHHAAVVDVAAFMEPDVPRLAR